MGKGGGGSAPTSTTAYQTNLPEYAQPYVMNMLGAAQNQLFTTTPGTDGKPGEITGFRPYTPYSTDPTQYFAGPSSLQQSVYNEAGQMQTPGQYAPATGLAGMAGMQQMRAGQQYARQMTDPYAVQSYMSPYQQSVTDIAKMNAVRESQIAGQQANLGAARQGTYGGARQALAGAEREKNLLANLSNIQAQGSQAAYDKAIQNMQYGANLGLQGLSGATQAASTLGGLGTAQQQADLARMGFQQQTGAAQQQYQQNIINQAIQDYATAQQYPYMQLSTMSNLLRGLPMQSMSTQQYQAQAPLAQQALGLAGAYGAYKGAFKEGGAVKRYDVGGSIDADIDQIAEAGGVKGLERLLAQTKSPEARKRIIERMRSEGIAAAPTGKLGTNLAGGGIIAFDDGGDVQKKLKEWQAAQSFLGFGGDSRIVIDPDTGEEMPMVKLKEKQYLQALQSNKPAAFSPATVPTKTQLADPTMGEKPQEAEKPSVPAAAPTPAAAPASTGRGLPAMGAKQFLADRTAMYKELGIDPTANERSKKLMEYYDEQRAKQGEQSAEQSRFNKALAFLEAGQTVGGLGAAALAGGKRFLTGEAEIQKNARAAERLNMEAAEKLESAQRKEAKGDIDGAMKDYADYRRDMVSLQVAEIGASSAGQATQLEREAIANYMKENPGMTYSQAYQAVKGAGRMESNELQKQKAVLASLDAQILTAKKEEKAALQKRRDEVYKQMLASTSPIGAGPGKVIDFNAIK